MDLPPFETFLDSDNMAGFWGYMKWILFFIAPIIMIWVAMELVGRVVGVVRNTVDDDDDAGRRRYYDEDDDYYR